MSMRKIVSESVFEFKKRKSLNEGIFRNLGNFIKKVFKRVKKFFWLVIGDRAEPVILPVNIGIMVKDGILSPAISYVPNDDDLLLEPGLRTESPKSVIEKRRLITNESLNEARVPLEHPDKNVPNINRDELYMEIEMAIRDPEGKPLMIWGAPGIGKTEIVKAVLEANSKGRLIDVQTSKMAPDDWNLPAIVKMEAGEVKALDIPKSWLPVYKPTGNREIDAKLDRIANGGTEDEDGPGGVIFLDELSRASSSVQNTCLKLIGERIIGDAKLGSKWAIISASNRAGDDPDSVQNFSTALGNRFQQVNYVPDFRSWKEWGMGKIDQRILDFLEFNQEYFYNLDDDPEKSIFASPRTWAAASDSIARVMQYAKDKGIRVTVPMLTRAVGKNVGLDIATEFSTFLRLLESFRKEDIEKVFNSPEEAPLPKKAGSGYDQSEANAIISLLVSSTRGRELTPEEFTNFCKYLVRLDNPSLATKGLKMMFDAHKYMHKELGEVPGHDKYKEGVDIFIEKYKDIF